MIMPCIDTYIDIKFSHFYTFTKKTTFYLMTHIQTSKLYFCLINDIIITVPRMEFLSDQYTIAENNRSINVPVYRHGDVSYQSSVICYTRQHSAQVMMDFEERIFSELSRIVFEPGDKVGTNEN